MHSPHQIQCLQELGISFLQLKDDFSKTSRDKFTKANESNVEPISWDSVAQTWFDDLKVLFPQLQVKEQVLHLNTSLRWQLVDLENVNINAKQITTRSPKDLTVNEMSTIWQFLSSQLNND